MSTEANVTGTVSAQCQKIVEDANAGRVTFADARRKLLSERLPEVVLKSYLVQFQQPIGGEGSDRPLAGNEDRGVTPEGLDANQQEEFRRKRAEILGQEGSHSGQRSGGESSRRGEGGEGGVHSIDPLSGLANFGPGKERSSEYAVLEQQLKAIQLLVSGDSGSVSASTLDSLPHLREKARSTGDLHIDKTLQTKKIYLKEQNCGALIDLFQSCYLPEPLPRSIWKLILKDEYISFEKLLAGIDPSYDHQDEGRDFGAGYTLVKKDHLSARKPVVSESDWNRAFDAWKNGVILAFLIEKMNFQSIEWASLTSFAISLMTLRFRSALITKFARDIIKVLSASMTGLELRQLSWRLFIVLLWAVNLSALQIRALRLGPTSVPPAQSVSTGTVGDVMIPVSMVDDMESVQSAKRIIEPLILLNTKPSSSPEDLETSTTGNWAPEAVQGPRPLIISPLVLFSETASPLPGPPSYVLDDSLIQVTLIKPEAYLKTHTPYSLDQFYPLSFWLCHSEDSSMDIAISNSSMVDASIKELIQNIIDSSLMLISSPRCLRRSITNLVWAPAFPSTPLSLCHLGHMEARSGLTFLLSETVSALKFRETPTLMLPALLLGAVHNSP
ncbi:hypothetical protein F5878DRAFT_675947 [Lentinula raphanica]|uniref:Uncharacterized protein n=1 Tax=Lentinula raphanica TaxID=153919 RepID=A0AA38U9N7_9AGAR|nr:hypothetical protein F5878DRAFT_675947 [Lentinula raphanica]